MFSLIIVVTGLILGLVLRHQNTTGTEIITEERVEKLTKTYIESRNKFIWLITAAIIIYVLLKTGLTVIYAGE